MPRFENDISLRDVVRVLFRQHRKIALWSVGVLLVTLLVTLSSNPTYRSECKLLVRLGRENVVLDPTAAVGNGPVTAVPQTLEGEINSIVEILQSRGLLEKLVDQFGPTAILDDVPRSTGSEASAASASGSLESEPPTSPPSTGSLASIKSYVIPQVSDRERAIERLENDLVIEPVKRSDVITMTYDAGSPVMAQQVLQALVDLYLDHHLQLHRAPGAREFFVAQAEETRSRLEKAADELRKLKNSTGIAAIDEERRIMMTRIGELRVSQLTNQSDLATAEVQVSFLTKRLETLPEQIELGRMNGFSGPAAGLSQQVHSLQSKERSLSAEFGEDDTRVKEVHQQLTRAREAAGSIGPNSVQINTGVNRVFEEARLALFNEQSRVASLRARSQSIETQLVDAQQELQKLNDNEVRMAQLEREMQLHDAGYRKYAENLEQARIDEALQLQRMSNIRLAEPPTRVEKPISPRPIRNLALGFLVAVLGGSVIAFCAERMDSSIKSSRELERYLETPTLVSIPRFRSALVRTNGRHGEA